MSQPVPRNLPALIRDAVTAGWDVDLRRGYGPSYDVRFRRFNGTSTDAVRVEWWPKGDRFVIDAASINGQPTPYAQCTRLIRSPEGATS